MTSVQENQVIVRRPPPPESAARPGARQVAKLLVLALAGAGLGFLGAKIGAKFVPPVAGPGWVKFLLLLWVVPAWLITVGWHELGHLTGGWLTGGRFLLWIVGPFKVQRTPAGLQAGWNRSLNLGGGLAACLPLEPARMTPGRAAVMVLGGPVFSLLLAGAGLGLLLLLPATPPDARAWLVGRQLVAVTAGLSGLIALVTLFPATAGGFKSDGRRVVDLLRPSPRADQEAAMLALTTATLAGQRPGDFDPGLVARALSLRDGSLFDLYANLTVFPHAAERGEWAEAQAHLDRLVAHREKLAPMIRDLLHCEYAWLLATRTGDAAAARAWLEGVGRVEFDPATRLRAEAAVLLAEGRKAEAAARAREGLLALEHKSLSPVKSPFADDALQDLLAAAS